MKKTNPLILITFSVSILLANLAAAENAAPKQKHPNLVCNLKQADINKITHLSEISINATDVVCKNSNPTQINVFGTCARLTKSPTLQGNITCIQSVCKGLYYPSTDYWCRYVKPRKS